MQIVCLRVVRCVAPRVMDQRASVLIGTLCLMRHVTKGSITTFKVDGHLYQYKGLFLFTFCNLPSHLEFTSNGLQFQTIFFQHMTAAQQVGSVRTFFRLQSPLRFFV
jgi:hypothetical protein